MGLRPEVAIIGDGWVGKSMSGLFPEATVYDEPLERLKPKGRELSYKVTRELGRRAVNNCDIAFICVPTPGLETGNLDTSIVEEVVDWCESDIIVIRSTLQPGTSDRLKERTAKRIVTQPEYLGESTAHPLLDQGERPFMILGGEKDDNRKVIEAYQGVYNANINIRQVTNYEAEVIKLSENRAVAFKVAQAQELYDACQEAGIDYYTIREAVYSDDPRFNLWHTFVYPDKRGMDSKCIPKDVYAWAAWAESLGYDPKITNALLEKNQEWVE